MVGRVPPAPDAVLFHLPCCRVACYYENGKRVVMPIRNRALTDASIQYILRGVLATRQVQERFGGERRTRRG